MNVKTSKVWNNGQRIIFESTTCFLHVAVLSPLQSTFPPSYLTQVPSNCYIRHEFPLLEYNVVEYGDSQPPFRSNISPASSEPKITLRRKPAWNMPKNVLDLLLDTEDGGNTFFWVACWLSPDYKAMWSQTTELFTATAFRAWAVLLTSVTCYFPKPRGHVEHMVPCCWAEKVNAESRQLFFTLIILQSKEHLD